MYIGGLGGRSVEEDVEELYARVQRLERAVTKILSQQEQISEASWGPLGGGLWGLLITSWGLLWASWGPLGDLLGGLWGLLGTSWGLLGASWGILGALLAPLG